MKKAAVIFANGCEEVEALTVVDVLRRAEIQCDMLGLGNTTITGAHHIIFTCDGVVDEALLDYDLVAFPGGMGGSYALRDDQDLAKLMVKRHQNQQWNAAMCAAPIAFARYGILDNAKYTIYPGMEEDLVSEVKNGEFKEDLVVVDDEQKIITSRGPATALAYSFAIGEAMGSDMTHLKQGMLYDLLAEKI
ncbi:4-methyl-5(b-hydroxyethyl)-thiazole monophosphate biosynthesis [Granulicatella balaenopterae]|uniref:4-methyl-5(B-hydroxyethyl)-thiazole monophosphate biosynthesis n=1 Tax=Granulicatella balaenopterae TaxID=137733 RepID=A0A1H9M5M1_9LACT|nr:DJ-1 family glyoxalase III [Granulicatella balaenopterae]SER19038.1 4-methyl-5(b-hydroxyethyl)-thiazole monophosphate biosynthesis [Granulicatella balaenopterae]